MAPGLLVAAGGLALLTRLTPSSGYATTILPAEVLVGLGIGCVFTPSIGVFALITGCYTGIIFAVTTARDRGIIKRVVGTPLPPGVFVAAWACSAIAAGFCSVLLLIVVCVPPGSRIWGRSHHWPLVLRPPSPCEPGQVLACSG